MTPETGRRPAETGRRPEGDVNLVCFPRPADGVRYSSLHSFKVKEGAYV